jgi:putative ABC transport system substrate-binding protein
VDVRRREFITLFGGVTAASAWPQPLSAQGKAIPVIGYLSVGAAEPSAHLVAAFRQGLGEAGYIEGQNVAVEYRWAGNDSSQLPELAADLVRRRVAVIVTPAATPAALAAKAATARIPIVFSVGADPVQVGLVGSLNRPGGNATGVGAMTAEIVAKRLGLLHELLPEAKRFAILVNPNNPLSQSLTPAAQAMATAIGRQIEVIGASTNHDIDTVFASLSEQHIDALLVSPDTLFINRRVQLTTLAIRYAVPAIFPFHEDAALGGLMSYGPSITDNARLVGNYAGRVLKGEKPADLPVLQSTKFEFVINLQTAKTLGLSIPAPLLARADEVIE